VSLLDSSIECNTHKARKKYKFFSLPIYSSLFFSFSSQYTHVVILSLQARSREFFTPSFPSPFVLLSFFGSLWSISHSFV
jgi:hypothetical protein